MKLAGFYPFTVSIWNLFEPKTVEPLTGVTLNVVFKHHPCCVDNNSDFKGIREMRTHLYSIGPSQHLAFPMFYGDESLELSIDLDSRLHLPPQYMLSAGDTAVCFPSSDLGLPQQNLSGGPKPTPPTPNGTGWFGGTWGIGKDASPDPNSWKMTIRKISTDPVNDDVTVGPGTPG